MQWEIEIDNRDKNTKGEEKEEEALSGYVHEE